MTTGKTSVVVVDDDYMVASLHREYVERVPGFEVSGVALSGREALDMVAELKPQLVLLDIYLPDVSGLEVMRTLRLDVGVDVIAVTAARDVDTLQTAMRYGVIHYLVKPFTFPALRERLERYHQWTDSVAAVENVSQDDVDRLVGVLRYEPATRALPKGMSGETLDLIVRIVNGASSAEVTAVQVASEAGVSRVTARRYLEHLRAAGRVAMRLRYGSSGRPTHLYFSASRSD